MSPWAMAIYRHLLPASLIFTLSVLTWMCGMSNTVYVIVDSNYRTDDNVHPFNN